MNRIDCTWTLAPKDTREAAPDAWVPATVPGGAQLDWANAHKWGDYNYGQNARQYDGLEEKYWLYRAKPNLPPVPEDQALFFVAKGIDYAFDILIDGEVLHSQEGMFTPVELDVTDKMRPGSVIEVLIHPAPKREGAPWHTRDEADQCCKPAVSYGWDWHPYLVVLGIWDDCYFDLRPRERISSCELFYTLSYDLSVAHIHFETETTTNVPVHYTLTSPDGWVVFESDSPDFILENPRLWWCRGQGEPNLYKWAASIPSGHSVSGRTGFRSISLSQNADFWAGFKGSRANPPITITLNGRRIFAKGSNWVNPELFPGTITRETYAPLIDLATCANFNILRIWGGAIVNKDSFFDLCDETGLMVWQEFPLACNNYIGTPRYLKILEQEAVSIIRRVRTHPCHVLWCGGNELFTGWSRMTDQSLALRLLNKLCYEQDQHKPFLPTSPVMGMSHGYYQFRYPEGIDVFAALQAKKMTAYTEFGVPSLPEADYLRTFIPEDELFPPMPGGSYEFHHAFNAWNGLEPWLSRHDLEHYFGPASDLEALVLQSQWLQREGYKAMFEEARRQKPYCSMALNWCYNEPWKTAANNSIIAYPAVPKKAYYAVAESCRDTCLSLRIPKFDWQLGETITVEPWLLNDAPQAAEPMTVDIMFRIGEQEIIVGTWECPGTAENENVQGDPVTFTIPQDAPGSFMLTIACAQDESLSSSYTLLIR